MNSSKNLLGNEHSPYLLQHKDNPVFWSPWGPAAFKAAADQNKPIFLSIGYSTCYWCHVMEHDSFEHQEVADVLNQSFISIKLDREERPDIDQVYMDAVVGLTGHGGWPMSVFLTPELKPFWAGTFFYRADFIAILQGLAQAWQGDRENVQASAQKIIEVLRTEREGESGELNAPELLKSAFNSLQQHFDRQHGGFGSAPKFPPSQQVRLLLRLNATQPNDVALKMADSSLECMARGGIYDQLGGGFHRYSTDAGWTVPHFEKMLYDNALLVVAYLEAYQVTKKLLFASVARETLEYVAREMCGESGQFFCAQDAGAVDKEGEYYVWSSDELKTLLDSEEFAAIRDSYQITDSGNFENNTNILVAAQSLDWSAKEVPPLLTALKKLRTERALRASPLLDDKTLTGWNGLMIAAFATGFRVLGEARYLKIAQRAASFIHDHLYRDGKLLRRFRGGDSAIDAVLEDYSYLISGLIELYQCDFDTRWLLWARRLQSQQDAKFWDVNRPGYLSSKAADVIVQKREFADGATPSANSVSLSNLARLFAFFGDTSLRTRHMALLAAMAPGISEHPTAYCTALQDLANAPAEQIEVVISAGEKNPEKARELVRLLYAEFAPGRVIGFNPVGSEVNNAEIPLLKGRGAVDGATAVYVCRNGVCKLPVFEPGVDIAQNLELFK